MEPKIPKTISKQEWRNYFSNLHKETTTSTCTQDDEPNDITNSNTDSIQIDL